MGDVTTSGSTTSEYPPLDAVAGGHSAPAIADSGLGFVHSRGLLETQSSHPAQYPPQYAPQGHAFHSQFDMAQPQMQARSDPYNMNSLANTLPLQAAYRQNHYTSSTQRFNPVVSSANLPAQNQGSVLYSGQQAHNHMQNQQFFMTQHNPMATFYGSSLPQQQQQQGNGSNRGNLAYYPQQMVMSNQQPPSPAAYYYAQTGVFTGPQGVSPQMLQGQFYPNTSNVDTRRNQQRGVEKHGVVSSTIPKDPKQGVVASRSNLVRGPPRKPKQSGHAIWIGNLPPQTDLMSLVHHVCREAAGLESLFLISKSNCAFANFRDEMACLSAQQKLHDSKFQSVRLVSRLRKSTVEGASGITAPTGPAASASQPVLSLGQESLEKHQNQPDEDDAEVILSPVTTGPVDGTGEDGPLKDRYFILKSLTEEDLELSVQTGIWATQAHNEETLNSAFKSADNVFLVFSANKSGEYFGYAKMTSPINNDPAAAIEFAPKAQTADDVDLPKAIPTEATEHAPRGRIIDDSARGTIFWEAERDEISVTATTEVTQDVEEAGSVVDGDDSGSAKSGQEGEGKAWGKPFKLQWLSTLRLPFYRTRGLRNSWNSNREVKIARDGTEIEPIVGKKLIGLFSRVQSPPPSQQSTMGRSGPIGAGSGMVMMSGYPPMQSAYPQ